MSFKDKITNMLNAQSNYRWESFCEELNQDENKDYRRGFKAGILCATLQLKSDVSDIDEGQE